MIVNHPRALELYLNIASRGPWAAVWDQVVPGTKNSQGGKYTTTTKLREAFRTLQNGGVLLYLSLRMLWTGGVSLRTHYSSPDRRREYLCIPPSAGRVYSTRQEMLGLQLLKNTLSSYTTQQILRCVIFFPTEKIKKCRLIQLNIVA